VMMLGLETLTKPPNRPQKTQHKLEEGCELVLTDAVST
jgi:hypothetical protein